MTSHKLTITQVPSGVFDWECSCLLIAGQDIDSAEAAADDAVAVHERSDAALYTRTNPTPAGPGRWSAGLRVVAVTRGGPR